MSLQCVVIDDEPLARECVQDYIRQVDFMEVAGVGINPVDLSRLLAEQPVDLIFLDIQMPVMNGIEFLRMMPVRPMVILTTAYPHYALESFQLDVLDYLVKPITFDRFFKAAAKARDYHRLLQPPASSKVVPENADYFFIKCDYRYEKIYFNEIIFVEALQNYVSIQTTRGKFMTLLYLKTLEEKLDSRQFIRVHKSFLAAMGHIDAIENNELVMGTHRVPVSRNYKDDVIAKVVNNRLWKK